MKLRNLVLAGIAAAVIGTAFYLIPRNSREEQTTCNGSFTVPEGVDKKEYIKSKGISVNLDCVKYPSETMSETNFETSNLENKVNPDKVALNSGNNLYNNSRNNIDEMTINISNKYGVDPAFVKAVRRAESGDNPIAVSDMSAAGLMQLTEEIGRKYGLNIPDYKTKIVKNGFGKEKIISVCNKIDLEEDPNVCDFEKDERFDPEKNMEAGIHHLKDLLEKHEGGIDLTLAEYHAGNSALNESKVEACIGQRKFKCLKNKSYRETRRYIEEVKKYYKEHQNI